MRVELSAINGLSLCFFELALCDAGIDTFNEALTISKTPALKNRLVSDLGYIALKWMYFAHDCLNMGKTEAFNRFANDALNIVEIGVRFDPSNNGLNRLTGKRTSAGKRTAWVRLLVKSVQTIRNYAVLMNNGPCKQGPFLFG